MSSTISGYLSGVTFGVEVTSPLTITSSGAIGGPSSTEDAVYAAPTYANAVVINHGVVNAYSIGSDGVDLKDGGSVYNSGIVGGVTPAHINGDSDGVYIKGGGTVTNAAYIVGVGDAGVVLEGGYVDNSIATALIKGAFEGVVISGNGTVTNSGTITSSVMPAVGIGVLLNTGLVTNTGNAALIYGVSGIVIDGSAGMVVNHGSIIATGNQGLHGGTAGNYGVFLRKGGTVWDSGTISGAYAAVSFAFPLLGGTADNRMVLYPGYKLVGKVLGNPTAGSTNTVELSAGASSGSVSSLTTEFVHFGTVQVDSGAQWALSGNYTTGAGGLRSALPGR